MRRANRRRLTAGTGHDAGGSSASDAITTDSWRHPNDRERANRTNRSLATRGTTFTDAASSPWSSNSSTRSEQ